MVSKFTHKGWFGICPVYFGDLETESPNILERHWLFIPLMDLSELFFRIGFHIMEFFDAEYEPSWPLRITGELKAPILFDEDDVQD